MIIVICGPTGVGKSDLAFEVAKLVDGELISCDSVQVYKDLDIGTNKTARRASNREKMLDLISFKEDFTAGRFYDECMLEIKEILKRGKTPILVGGTGFYMDWILHGKPGAPPCSEATLSKVSAELEQDGNWEISLERLKAVDEEYSKKILKNDYYRLKRALAVYEETGQNLTSFKTRRVDRDGGIDSEEFKCFFLTSLDREYLCRNIDKRCEKMIQGGLLEEVAGLMEEGLDENCSAGRSIGYFETIKFLKKIRAAAAASGSEGDRERGLRQEFFGYLNEFKAATRQYSRKQENWFKGRVQRGEFVELQRPTPFEPLTHDSEVVKNLLAALNHNKRVKIDDRVKQKSAPNFSFMKTYRSDPSIFESNPSVWTGLLDLLKKLQKNKLTG